MRVHSLLLLNVAGIGITFTVCQRVRMGAAASAAAKQAGLSFMNHKAYSNGRMVDRWQVFWVVP